MMLQVIKWSTPFLVGALLVLAGYQLGRSHEKEACLEQQASLIREINENAKVIQKDLSSLSENLDVSINNLSQDVNVILARTKKTGTPTIIVKDGKCIPHPTFSKDVNSAIDAVNKSISEK